MTTSATVLLIEDNPDLGRLLVDVLEENRIEAILALDPNSLPVDVRPSAIVTDLFTGAPWYDRESASAHVAALRDRFPGTPIIVLTAHVEAAKDVRAIGADAIIDKPFDVEVLTTRLRSLLRPSLDMESAAK